MSDDDLFMYSYYLQKGHTLKSLLDLSYGEKIFYKASISLLSDKMNEER